MNRSRSAATLLGVPTSSSVVAAQEGSVPLSALLPTQPTIVLDIGASSIKIGIAGESVVRVVVPTPVGLQRFLLDAKYNGGVGMQQEVTSAIEFISTKLTAPSLSPVLVAPSSGGAGLARKQSTRHMGSSKGLVRTNSMSRTVVPATAPSTPIQKPPRVALLVNGNATNTPLHRLLTAEIKRRVGIPVSAAKASDAASAIEAPHSPSRDPRKAQKEKSANSPLDELESQLAQRPVQVVCGQISALAAYGPSFTRLEGGGNMHTAGGILGHLGPPCGLVVDAGFSGTRAVPVVCQSIATGGEVVSSSGAALGSHYSAVGVAPCSGLKRIIDTMRDQIIRDHAKTFEKHRIPESQLRPGDGASACLLSDDLLQDVLIQYAVVPPPPGHPSRPAVLSASYPVVVKTFFVQAKPNIAIEKCLFFPCLFALNAWAHKSRAITGDDGIEKTAPLTHSEEVELLTLPLLFPGDEALPLPEAMLSWWIFKVESPDERLKELSSLSCHVSAVRATLQSLAACHPWLELPVVTGNFKGAVPMAAASTSLGREGGAPLLLCGACSNIPFFTERFSVALTGACHRVLTEAKAHWARRNDSELSQSATALPFIAKCEIQFGGASPTCVRGWDTSSTSLLTQLWPNSNKRTPTQVDSWYAMGQLLATSILHLRIMSASAVSTRKTAALDDDLRAVLRKVSATSQVLGAMALFA